MTSKDITALTKKVDDLTLKIDDLTTKIDELLKVGTKSTKKASSGGKALHNIAANFIDVFLEHLEDIIDGKVDVDVSSGTAEEIRIGLAKIKNNSDEYKTGAKKRTAVWNHIKKDDALFKHIETYLTSLYNDKSKDLKEESSQSIKESKKKTGAKSIKRKVAKSEVESVDDALDDSDFSE